MSARWQLLCGILVLGLWLATASSKECPYRSGHHTTGYVPKPLYPGAANIQSDCYNTNPDHGYKSPSKEYSGVPQRSYCPKLVDWNRIADRPKIAPFGTISCRRLRGLPAHSIMDTKKDFAARVFLPTVSLTYAGLKFYCDIFKNLIRLL